MNLEPTAKSDAPVLGYAEAGRVRKPFSLLALFAGLITPYVYAAVAFVFISPFGYRGSGVEAFYALHPAAIIAMAAFPLLVWLIGQRIRYRGFVRGVVIGTVVLPVLAVVALAVSLSRGM